LSDKTLLTIPPTFSCHIIRRTKSDADVVNHGFVS
jgi:hypothetical protein